MSDLLAKLLTAITTVLEDWFKSAPKVEEKLSSTIDYGLTPWMKWMTPLIGGSENNPVFAKKMEVYWKLTDVPSFKGLAGGERAWCALTVNAALDETGFKGTHNASAISFKDYGKACDYKYGAIIVIQHAGGGNHVTFFHSWKDQSKNLMNCLGGNQSDHLQISTYDVSGNSKGHDEVIGCRWPVVK